MTQNNTAPSDLDQQETALDSLDAARRWRLILGRYSDQSLSAANLSGEQLKLQRNLDYLYQNEYKRRGVQQGSNRHGGLEGSQLTAINWLNQSRKLFPKSTFERMQKHFAVLLARLP